MLYMCDAPQGKTWFRIETEAEAAAESALMQHAVEKFFRAELDRAIQSYRPEGLAHFEREIGLKAHLKREMPMFLTLRDDEGNGLATAMVPPGGHDQRGFRAIVVGAANKDPYPDHGDAIASLGHHLGLALERERCYPYRRG